MPKLSATFCIDISSPCLMALPDEQVPDVTVELDGFKVTARLIPAQHWLFIGKDDANKTTRLSELEVTLSRDEDDLPPDEIETPVGRRDLGVQGEYLRSKLPAYQVAALKVANRVLRFFQHSLLTPLAHPIHSWDHALHNPTWRDSDGRVLRGGILTIMVEAVPGLRGEMGARKLSSNELPALQAFIETTTEPGLAETLLSDAQDAWFEGNLRRAILELAICAEVLVKRRFFSKDSPAGAAFDYLEDKAKVSVRVLDLLDTVAKEAFARSYKKEEPSNYQSIDYLFRCRNKIAHRGELPFRDDSGQLILVDPPMVETWWRAVANLKGWLEVV